MSQHELSPNFVSKGEKSPEFPMSISDQIKKTNISVANLDVESEQYFTFSKMAKVPSQTDIKST